MGVRMCICTWVCIIVGVSGDVILCVMLEQTRQCKHTCQAVMSNPLLSELKEETAKLH